MSLEPAASSSETENDLSPVLGNYTNLRKSKRRIRVNLEQRFSGSEEENRDENSLHRPRKRPKMVKGTVQESMGNGAHMGDLHGDRETVDCRKAFTTSTGFKGFSSQELNEAHFTGFLQWKSNRDLIFNRKKALNKEVPGTVCNDSFRNKPNYLLKTQLDNLFNGKKTAPHKISSRKSQVTYLAPLEIKEEKHNLSNNLNVKLPETSVNCFAAPAKPLKQTNGLGFFKENFPGFKSGKGTALEAPKNVLQNVQNLFKNENLTDVCFGNDGKTSSLKLQKFKPPSAAVKTPSSEPLNQIFGGFKLGTGKTLQLPESVVNQAQNLFKHEDLSNDFLHPLNPETPGRDCNTVDSISMDVETLPEQGPKPSTQAFGGFKLGSGKSLNVPKSVLNQAQSLFKHEDLSNDLFKPLNPELHGLKGPLPVKGAQSVAFNAPKLKPSSAVSLFEDIEGVAELCKAVEPGQQFIGFQSGHGQALVLPNNAVQSAQNLFKDEWNLGSNTDCQNGADTAEACGAPASKTSQTGTEQNVLLPEQPLDKAQDRLGSEELNSDFLGNCTNTITAGTDSAACTARQYLEKNIQGISRDFSEYFSAETSFQTGNSWEDKEDDFLSNIDLAFGKDIQEEPKSPARRRLYPATPSSLKISRASLEKAKQLFDDTAVTPEKRSAVFSSTPLRPATFMLESDITPIKAPEALKIISDGIVLKDGTKGDVEDWCLDLDKSIVDLQDKLSVLIRRQDTLRVQKHMLQMKPSKIQHQDGVLMQVKHNTNRLNLKDFIVWGSNCASSCNITPENAEKVHFKCDEFTNFKYYDRRFYLPNSPKSERYIYVMCRKSIFTQTADGFQIVPNRNHLIGIAEIALGFSAMKTINASIIPNGWLRNHFKWIVWKLAGYQNNTRNYPQCLNLENVLQQLKYRYDRELYRAQRPSLRKIYETDDGPQKRIVLCVADIIPGALNFELELTDGWYSIRTVLDPPLCRQITARRVQIGTKLLIYGAELLNCQGCHPLQASEDVRLKINYNSTRRAAWFVKLGYQRCPLPFLLSVNSIHPDGGLIGRVHIYIARAYPVKYREKQNTVIVWRNKKAEENRARAWELEYSKQVERIRESVCREYEKKTLDKKEQFRHINERNIQAVDCPETLCDILESSNDPEYLTSNLSASQQTSILECQQRRNASRQNEIKARMDASLRLLTSEQRNVVPVLQLRVLDVENPETQRFFQIWNPTETHFQNIKEEQAVTVFHVLPKNNGDLSSAKLTKFHPLSVGAERFQKYKRTATPISTISSSLPFNEFDTVGMVVLTEIKESAQTVWLADLDRNFLNVQILEGSRNCSLFDNLRSGEFVALSNVIFCQGKEKYKRGIANHSTSVTSLPQQQYLKDEIGKFQALAGSSHQAYLEECLKILDSWSNNESRECTGISRDLDESTFVSSKITKTDIALSAIDLKKFFE